MRCARCGCALHVDLINERGGVREGGVFFISSSLSFLLFFFFFFIVVISCVFAFSPCLSLSLFLESIYKGTNSYYISIYSSILSKIIKEDVFRRKAINHDAPDKQPSLPALFRPPRRLRDPFPEATECHGYGLDIPDLAR